MLPLKAVMVAGEHLSKQDHEYIEKSTMVPLYTLYASREVGFLGYECEWHAMHISEEWAYLEVVNEKGERLPFNQEGRIVVTTFDNRVMPFIRYELGDIGSISDVPCACGRTLRTLTFKGRTTELITLTDNRTVTLLDLAFVIGSYKNSIRQYQIIQTSPLTFTVRVIPLVRFDERREELENMLVRMLHPRVQIQWEIVEHIPESQSGKAVYFIRDFTTSV